MNLYTIDKSFNQKDSIETFQSIIWTERYSEPGEAELKVPATNDMIQKLPENIYLALSGSNEIMMMETTEIEKNVLTLKGKSLLEFLSNRQIRTSTNHADKHWSIVGSPGEILGVIVQEMCVSGAYISGAVNTHGVVTGQSIPNLEVGYLDSSWPTVIIEVPYGPVLNALIDIAKLYSLGQTIQLESPGGPLVYQTYFGRDLTSGQTAYPLVRFSSAQDSLVDVKELRSRSGYKNVAFVFAPSYDAGLVGGPGVAYADAYASASVGFDRRVLMILDNEITNEMVASSSTTIATIMTQRAKDALANNNYIKMVDGELVPQNEFKYGQHYRLGDIIELQGPSGMLQRARVTEYIRVQDSRGERAYPTISVID